MLKVPGGLSSSSPSSRSTGSKPGQYAMLPRPVLKAVLSLQRLVKDVSENWAIAGDAGEVALGVPLSPDHIDVITTKKGCDDMGAILAAYQILPPAEATRKLEREMKVGEMAFPVFVKSHYGEFMLEGVRVEVFGDLQIRVGEIEWGDPIVFDATRVNLVGSSIPIFPLALKKELYAGLGWTDRAQRITEAMNRSFQHLRG